MLAKLSGGHYYDDQNGLACDSEQAFVAAMREIKLYVATAQPRDFAKHPFPGWDKLG